MLEAALWGFLTSASLLLGAGATLRFAPGRRLIGLTMAFGAGVLISAVAYASRPRGSGLRISA